MWNKDQKIPLNLVFKRIHNPDAEYRIRDYPYGINTDWVFIKKLKDHPEKKYIDTKCKKWIDEQGDQQNHETNVKGAMTDWYMAHLPGFKELCEIAVEFSREAYPWLTHPMCWDVWGNRYTSGQYADAHWHRPAQISWTYYPWVDDDHPGLYFPDMAPEGGGPGITINPEDGDLLMWLGDVRHQVHAKEFKNPRYVMAGNMFFEYRTVDDEFRLDHHTEANAHNRKEMKEKLEQDSKAAKTVFSTSEME